MITILVNVFLWIKEEIVQTHDIKIVWPSNTIINRYCDRLKKTQLYAYFLTFLSSRDGVYFSSSVILTCLWLSYQFSSVQFSRSVVSDSLRPHESQHARTPCPSPTPSIESVRPSSHLILCRPLLLLPSSPPSIRVFSNESTLRMRYKNHSVRTHPNHPNRSHYEDLNLWIFVGNTTQPRTGSDKPNFVLHKFK